MKLGDFMVCAFFGHRQIPNAIEPKLKETTINLILNKNVDVFYVGNQGGFDSMVRKCLRELKSVYPHISYAVVLAYMPSLKDKAGYIDYCDTIYPEGLEKSPPKFAIINRNKWMINQSDYVVVYVDNIVGGAVKFKEMAERKGKIVINIAE